MGSKILARTTAIVVKAESPPLMTKAELIGSLSTLDTLIQIFAVLVAVGIVGEVGFGVRHWVLNRRLQVLQRTEDQEHESVMARLNKEAGDADERSKKLQKDNLILQTDLLKLRRESEPRRLTGAQKDKLRRLLGGRPTPIAIVSRLIDTESSDFADDFAAALHEARWDPVRIKNRASSRYGLSIGAVAEGSNTPEIKLLDEALTAIGVPHDVVTFKEGDASTSPAFQSHVLYLVVEQKPLPGPLIK